jgi:hypothetical protein
MYGDLLGQLPLVVEDPAHGVAHGDASPAEEKQWAEKGCGGTAERKQVHQTSNLRLAGGGRGVRNYGTRSGSVPGTPLVNPATAWPRRDGSVPFDHGVATMGFGSKLLTGSVLAVIGLITVRVLTALFGAVMGFLSFVLFTVLPIVLIGWLIMKVFKSLSKDKKPSYE